MNVRLFLGIAGLLCWPLAQLPAAPPRGKPVVEIRVKTMIGRIITLDPKAGKLTLRVKEIAENIVVGPDCKFGSEEDGLAALSELRVGEQVIVTAIDQDDRLVARRITRLKPKKARAKPAK